MSRVIKSQWATPVENEKKVISIRVLQQFDADKDSIVETAPPVFQTDIEREQILEQARLEAEAIKREANEHADFLRNQMDLDRQAWEQEKAMMAEQAREAGYQQGLEEGRSRGYEEFRETIEFAMSVVDSSKADYQNKIDSSELTILDLGLKVAERIIGKRLESNPEDFSSIVKRALKEAREYREIQLHINPIHYGFLLSQKDELVKIFPRETELYIYPNDDLSEQSCIIESANGRIDASIDSQLEEIKRKLFELLESE